MVDVVAWEKKTYFQIRNGILNIFYYERIPKWVKSIDDNKKFKFVTSKVVNING